MSTPDRDPEHPRGRESSEAMTEVRTVLSRAESALDRIGPPSTETEWTAQRPGENLSYTERMAGRHEDPDADRMRTALTAVVALLEPWRKTGSTKRSTCL